MEESKQRVRYIMRLRARKGAIERKGVFERDKREVKHNDQWQEYNSKERFTHSKHEEGLSYGGKEIRRLHINGGWRK